MTIKNADFNGTDGKDIRFAGDVLIGEALPTAAGTTATDMFDLANTNSGIKVHAYVKDKTVFSTGASATITLIGADAKDATGTNLSTLAVGTLSGTVAAGTDIFTYFPNDNAKKYAKIQVASASGATEGSITVANEWIVKA